MALSYFFIEQLDTTQKLVTLDEETSYHIVQVLRMKEHERLQLADGKGQLATGHLVESHKKHCTVQIETTNVMPPPTEKVSIAISLLKNTSRFEWFLEKAVEMGINEIIPLLCERTIKEKFRYDRMKGICVSAMLQSQQHWLPVLHEPIAFELLFRQEELSGFSRKLIAHCMSGEKQPISAATVSGQNTVILIGPEGDFTPAEAELALQHRFTPVTLGNTRLRTETAGIAAAAILKLAAGR